MSYLFKKLAPQRCLPTATASSAGPKLSTWSVFLFALLTFAGSAWASPASADFRPFASELASYDAPAPLSLSLVATTPTDCKDYDGSLAVTANGGTWPYSYELMQSGIVLDNNTSGYFPGLTGGTYTVTVTDASFATADLNVVVDRVPPCDLISLTLVATTPTDCKDFDGSLAVTASGGTAPYNYVLMQGGVTLDNNSSGYFAGLTGGLYTVTVTDSTSATASLNVTVDRIPPCNTISLLLVATTPTDCKDYDGSLAVTASGGTWPYSYVLMQGGIVLDNNTSGYFAGLTGGLYTVTVTDANSATASLNVTVDRVPPCDTISLTLVATTPTDCKDFDGSLAVTASGGTWPYSYVLMQNGMVLDNNTSGYFAGLTGGLYTVTVTDANSATASLNVTVDRIPPCDTMSLLLVATTPTDCKDFDGSLAVTASGGTWPYSYVLMQNGVTLDNNTSGYFAGLTGGLYTVTVTDANSATASLNVTVDQVAPCNTVGLILVATTATDCKDYFGSLAVSATGGLYPFNYVLMQGGIVLDNNSSGYFAGLTGGVYTVTVTDANFATANLNVYVDRVPPCDKKKRVGDDAVTTTTAAARTMGTSAGSAGQFGLVAFPNPTSDHAQIEFQLPESGTAVLTVYSALGQKVTTLFDGSATANKPYRVSLNAERLANGVYSYTLRTASGSETRRLVVRH